MAMVLLIRLTPRRALGKFVLAANPVRADHPSGELRHLKSLAEAESKLRRRRRKKRARQGPKDLAPSEPQARAGSGARSQRKGSARTRQAGSASA
jgi:hypothetical protein